MGAPWTASLSLSVIWILYRVYLVFDKPVDELEEALGIDVPPIPEISLSGITKDAVSLYWKPPDAYHSPLQQDIQVNGVKVEDIEYSNGSVQIVGLQPGRSYVIRAVTTNNAGNSTYSRLVQVQTIPEHGNAGVKRLAETEHHLTKRRISGRRISQPLPVHDAMLVPPLLDADTLASSGTIAQLNEQLNSLRQDKDALELDLQNDSNEAENAEFELAQRRDALRQQVEAQEKEHQDKRKQVNELEKTLKTTQRRKQIKDQTLRQKRSERQKMQDDIASWKTNEANARMKMEELTAEETAIKESHKQKMQELDEKYATVVIENKTLEEELRNWSTKVNEAKSTARSLQNEEQQMADVREQEYAERMQQIKDDTRRIYAEQHQLNTEVSHLQGLHAAVLEDRQQDPDMYRILPHIDYPRAGHIPGIGSRSFAGSSQLDPMANPFPAVPFGISNRPVLGSVDMTRNQELDLTGGAMLSPGVAANLLPQSLLDGDEELLPSIGNIRYNNFDAMNPRSNSWDQDPQSPNSMHSASHSALNSPHESYVSIPYYNSMDADHQSLHSTGSPYGHGLTSMADAGDVKSRFFAWPNRRPKPNESPALGTLKTSQSQSFPLNEPENTSRKKNGTIWTSPMSMFTRGASSPAEDDGALAALARKKRGMLGAKLQPAAFESLDRSSSPRPASVSSRDFIHRPSSESNPWGSDGLRQRISPLGGGWDPSTFGSWSAAHSRRQSIQHGSTSNLSLGSLPTDADGQLFRNQPAPIGAERKNLKTKPKLNPAAPSFRVKVFGKGKPAKDGAESETPEPIKAKPRNKTKSTKRKDKNKEINHAESVESDLNLVSEEGSLPHSHISPRLSRDTYSYSQDDESQSSMIEPTSSQGDSQLLSTSTSAVTPSKESLIQKIQRKGSSKNFGASLSWKDRSFFSKKPSGEPLTPGDVEEDTSGSYLSKDITAESGTAPSTPIIEADREKPSRLSSSAFSRLMGKGKSKADKEEKEKDSLEADSSHDE